MAQNNPFLDDPFDELITQTAPKVPAVEPQEATPATATKTTPAAPRTSGRGKDGVLPPEEFRPLFEEAARKYDVPVNVLMALGNQESNYNPKAIGTQTQWGRAKGMMQYLDSTAESRRINPFDPAQSINAAAEDIKQRLDKGYSMEDAVKEHFAGPDRKQWGAKTALYGKEVMRRAGQIGDMVMGGAAGTPSAPSGPDPKALQSKLDTEEPGRYRVLSQDEASNKFSTATMDRDVYEDTFKSLNPTAPQSVLDTAMKQWDDDNKARSAAALAKTELSPNARFDIKLNDRLQGPQNGIVPALPGRMEQLPTNAATAAPAYDAETAAKESKMSAVKSQLGHSLKAGFFDLLGAGAKILDEINPWTLSPGDAAVLFRNDPAKLKQMQDESVAMILSRVSQSMTKNSEQAMTETSDRAKRDYNGLEYATLDADKTAFSSPVKVVGDAIRSLPTTVAMAVSLYLTKGAAAQAEKQALVTARTAGMSEEAAAAFANQARIQAGAKMMAKAGAASEGAVGYAQQANSSSADVRKLSDADLAKSPRYQELLKNGYTPETARAQLVSDTGEQAGMIAGIVDASVNKVGGEFLGRIMTEGGKLIPRIMKGAGNEAATEFTQSAGEQVGQNAATKQNVNSDQSLTEGVGEAAVQGAAVGGLMGGTMAGAAGAGHHAQQAAATPTPVAPTPAQAAGPMSAAVETAAAKGREVVSDDGKTYQFKVGENGITMVEAPPAGPMEAAVDAAAATQTPAETAPAPVAEPVVEPVAEPVEAPEPKARKAPTPKPAPAPAAIDEDGVVLDSRQKVEADLTSMDMTELRDRLKYIANQAKTNGGFDKRLINERKRVEREIDSRPPEPKPAPKPPTKDELTGIADRGDANSAMLKAAETTGKPHEVVERDQKGTTVYDVRPIADQPSLGNASAPSAVEPSEPVTSAADDKSSAAPAAVESSTDKQPAALTPDVAAGKWFGSREKAEAYIAKKKLGDSHVIDQTGKVRFEIKPKPQNKPQNIPNNISGADIDGDWMAFSDDSGTLNVPRSDMPQIKAEHRGAMVQFLNARGIEHNETEFSANYLKPTQAEFSRKKVEQAKGFEGGDRSILVSSDGHVLDGHHQWLAKRDAGGTVKAIQLDAPIADLLETIKEFPSATQAEGAATLTVKEPPAENIAAAKRVDEADKFAQIDAGFAENREALKKLKVGQDVEFTQPGTYTQPDGSKREGLVVRGKIEKVLDKGQGTVKVGNYNVQARKLRPATPADPETAEKTNKVALRKGDWVSFPVDADGNRQTGELVSMDSKKAAVLTDDGARVRVDRDSLDYVSKVTGAPKTQVTVTKSPGITTITIDPSAMRGKSANETNTPPEPPKGGGKPDIFAKNKVFTSSAVDAARARMKSKLSQLNSGIDPEMMMDGLTISGAYLEAGVRKFADYAKAMTDEFGDAIKPYLLSFYEAARHYPGTETDGMSTPKVAQAQHDAMMVEAAEVVKPAPVADTGSKEITNDTRPNAQDTDASTEGQATAPIREDEGRGNADDLFGQPDRNDDGINGRSAPAGDQRGNDRGAAGVRGKSATAPANTEQQLQSGRGSGAESSDRADRSPVSAAGSNYRIAQGELTREGSWAQTADRNLDVVELVKKLAAEKRKPTDAERAQMAKFTGWGASEIANGIFPNQYGNYKSDAWRARGERLQSLLTPEEYAQAKRTTQYAHYTSEGVIRSIYNGLDRLGFKGGTIVEPGMGVGAFAGLMPDGIAANSHYTGIEYDPITGAIAKALYPQSNITIGDFTKTALPKDFFDAAIGNPPFSGTLVLNDPEYKAKRPMLHDYFFMKTLDRVKPGGVLVFVTSKGTMDKTIDKSRSYLAERANLLGAIRLPQTAFQANAGTEVVTDVIFLQKRGEGIPDNGVKWMDVVPVKAGDTNVNVNEYFAAHPEMVLGEHATTGSMYRKDEYTVTPREGSDIEADFAKAVQNLPENVTRPPRGSMAEKALVQDRDFNPKHKKEGGLYVSEDGKLMQVEDGSGVELNHRTGADGKKIAMTPKQKKWLRDYVGVRDALKQAQYDQLNDGPWEKSLKALNKAYESFTKANGPILDYTVIERTNADGTTTETKRYKNEPLLRMDAEGALAYALEKVKEDGTIVKGAALNERVLKRPAEPEIKTTNDALFVSLNRTGALDINDVAALAGTDKETVLRDLGTAVYEAPGGQWQLADEYTSGNVLKKLKEAQAAAKIDKRFNRNVEALLAVQPKPLGPTDISVRLGANWVPASDIQNFAKEVMEQRADVTYSHLTGQWNVTPYGRMINEWNTDKVSAGAILDSVLNNRQIKVTWRDNEGKTHTDLEATEKANDVAGKMKDAFRSWIWKDTERAGRLVQHYNDNFNNIAPRQFDGSHLTLPGMTSRFVPHAHQKRGVWRVIQQGDTYLAHAVGAGKTAEMIMAGMEERRLGLSQKPMYIVPNHMLAQFSREFLELYPAANIMVADENNFHTHNRKRFIAQAALNNPDAIVITHSAFGRVGMSDEFTTKFVQNQIAEWQAALADADKNDRITVKQIEKRIEGLEKKLEGKQAKEKKDQVMTFEELGADRLFVDEFHEFRKLDFPTNQGNIKGIDPNGSQKSLDLFMKVQYLREKKPGRVLVGASGTPVTNTMGELFTAQRFFQPQQLEEDGLTSFDAWASQYGDVATGFEQNAAGGYEMVSRFAKFVNVPELMRRVRSFMDILTGSNLGALVQRPDVETGGRQIKVTPAPLGYKEYQKTLEARIKKIRETKGKPVKGADIILKVIGDGRFSAIDMRFVDPLLPSDPNSKLNQLIDDVIADYKETADYEYHTDNKTDPIKGASLMVFSDIGLGEQSAISRGFDTRAWMEQRFTEAGIPKDQVAFMRDYKQSAKKERLFADMREGKKRILIGGKEMETGTNVQKRLYKMYQLDAPWFPASVEQREGRIVRQGNQNPEVGINAYATKGSYDSTMWGMNARKARFIEQAMNGDDTVRSLEDVSEASAFEMAAALASGDERYMRLAGLKAEVEKMDRLRHAHHDEQNTLKRERHFATDRIDRNEALIADLDKAIAKRKPVVAGEFSGNVGKQSFDNREEFSMALFDEFKRLGDNHTDAEETLATVAGFPIKYYGVERKGSGFTADLHVDIPGDHMPLLNYPIDPGVAINGLATRALNQINGMDRQVSEAKQTIATSQRTLDQISKRVGAAFPEEQILLEKVSELELLQDELAKESVDAAAATEAAVATVEAEQDGPKFSVAKDVPTNQDTRAWAAEVKERLGLERFDVFNRGNGDLNLSMIEVPDGDRKQGKGTLALQEISDYADEHGLRIVLTPGIKDDRHGATSRSRLVNFYKRFGFVENKGRNKDFTISDGMFRDPKTNVSGDSIRYSVRDDGKPEAEFGPVHSEFRDNPAGAIDRLLKDKDGEAVAAVVRPDLGEISIVYGNDAYGLKHISDRRGAEFFKRLPDLLKNGTLYSKPNQVGRVFIGNEGTEAAIRLDWSGEAKTWLVSAYDKYPEGSAPAGTTNRNTANRGTSGVPKSQRSDVVMQRSEDIGKGMDLAGLDGELRSGALGAAIGKLIDSGSVRLYSAAKRLPKELRGAKGIQAVTAKDGTIHMVSATLSPERAKAVLLHEMFHGGTKVLIGNEQWSNLQGRLASLYRQSEQSSGKAREFWDKARERVAEGKKLGGVTTKFEVEEFGAYAIEEYESAPASVRKWVDDLIGAIKAWLLQRFGKQVGDLTPAQLRGLAVAALRSQSADALLGSESGSQFAAEVMTELAAHDDTFQYPRSKSRSLDGVLADVDPGIKYEGEVTAEDERSESGADHKYRLVTPAGETAFVYTRGKDVWLDVSRLKEGRGGNRIYAAVANYAHNNRMVFIGDPAGLSDEALRRRTDNMLSSALKFGTTDHLAPHPRQVSGDAELGVPPLKWKSGDTLANISGMIDVVLQSLDHHVPELKNARFDFQTGTFRTGKGQPLTDGMLRAWSEHPRIRAAGVGSGSLKRAIVLNTLVRSESSERPGLLESVLRQSNQHVALTGTLYSGAQSSRTQPLDLSLFSDVSRGTTASDILRKIASESKNAGYVALAQRLADAGINPSVQYSAPNSLNIKHSEGRKFNGAYDPKRDIVHLIRARGAERVFLHEMVHAATVKALQAKGEAAARIKDLYATVKAKPGIKAYGMVSVDEFVAEAFTNPEFQSQLEAIKTPGKFNSAWDRLVDIVRGLIGLPRNQSNVLAEVMAQQEALFDENSGDTGGESASDVRYSIEPDELITTPALTPPEQGMLRRVQGLIQDNMNRVKQVQDRIKKLTGATDLGYADYYGAETNRPGRVAARLEDMEKHLTKPLMTRLANSGYNAEQLSELLHAQHAQERNERVASINPEMPDGGSGMTTEEADAILETYRSDRELHRIAQQARDISKQTLALKLEYGLITQDDFDALAAAYKNYVPLKGDGEYGPKVKRAMGHEGRDEHILENIARDYSQAVVVGEKNLARQSLLAMVLQNPDPELWTVGVPPKGRYIAGRVFNIVHNGETVGSFTSRSQVDAFLEAKGADAVNYEILDSNGDQVKEFAKRLQNNEVLVYVNGDPVRIQIKDEALAKQLRPLDQGQMNVVLEKMRGMNRYFAKIYTGYNPAFILRNTARDAMTGTINMVGNEGVTTAAKAWARYPQAVTALARWAATGKTPAGKTGEYLTEYRLNGGKTGASWMSDLEQQGKTLSRLYEDAYGAGGYLSDGKVGRAAKVAGRKVIGGMAHVIEIANQATENALRLALYMQMREDGARPSIAAQAAKAVTVDFDRKGSATGALSALYLFVNPAIQGTANAAKTLHKGKHRYQAMAAISLLPMLGLFAAASGMDDDKDRWLGRNWDTRTKNFIFHVGSHEIRVPLSQEYAPFYAIGVAISEALRGESAMKSSSRIMSSFLDAYVPLQGFFSADSDNHGADAGLAMVPTIAQPIARSVANRNSFGYQIVPENDFTKDRPDNLKMYRGTKNSVFDSAAQAIASDSYNNDVSKVSPETLKMLWNTYTGGLGTFVTDSIGLARMSVTDSEGIDSGKVPFAKDFYRPNTVAPIRSRFFDLAKEAKEAAAEFKEAKKAGDADAMDKILRDPTKAELIALDKMTKATAKTSAKLRDEAVDVNGNKSLSASEKRAQLKELERQEEEVLRDGIAAFK